MRPRFEQQLWGYGAAILAALAATLLRVLLGPLVGAAFPFVTYFVASVAVAWYWGFFPATLSIVISAFAGTYIFISPATTSPFYLSTQADRVTVLGFVVGGLVVSALVDAERRTLKRLQSEVIRRQDAQDAEREQRQWFETTLASIGDAVIATDNKGNVIFMNPVAGALTGWSIDEARGLPLARIFHIVNEYTGHEVESPTDVVLQKGVVVGLANHTILISKDGRRIPLDDSGAPILRDGRVTGAVLVFRDVTERRRIQDEIVNSERRHRLLFESNPQPMWVYDRESLRFLAVNNAAVQQYGYSKAEFLEITLKDIRPAEEIPALLEDVAQHAASLHRDGPWRHRKRNGTVITVEISAHPIEFEGRDACLVLATDVTERQNLEEQFYQAQRLESIGRLAGGVAHDFNNLLTVINGYAAEILSEIPPTSPVGQMAEEISAAGHRAATLTQQLLAFSRRQSVEPKVVNLNRVVRDIDKMLRRLIGEHIHLVLALSDELSNIRVDLGQLEQIIINLAINARDAMPHGGSLTIRTEDVYLDDGFCAHHAEVSPGAYVMLGVADTGTGMTAEVRSKIFEPFFTTKPVGSGTGLGLATVHGMVQQSNGCIDVETETGAGTFFKIYFPARSEPVSAFQTPVFERELGGDETILVVEDQDDLRTLALKSLERYGYRVLSAAGGDEALTLAGKFPGKINLLLTDMIMPGMDGRTLANRLTQERDMRVLFMSGYNAAEPGEISSVGVGYIQKPFTPKGLAEKVRQVLDAKAESRTAER